MNNKTKDRYRRVIRVIMVLLAAFLLLLGLGVPVTNNAIAMGIARDMQEFELPADTHIVDVTSAAGRFGGRGSIRYFGALLLRSDLSEEALQTYYSAFSKDLQTTYHVERQSGRKITCLGDYDLSFHESVEDDDFFIVYTVRRGGNALQWWMDMDTRG